MNANRKHFLYALLIVIIFAAGTATAGAFDYIQLPVVHFIDKSVPPAKIIDCDRSATTTDCASIPKQTTAAPSQKQAAVSPLSYGSLSETYRSPAGFTFTYPKELQIETAGDTILNDSRNSKYFALKICEPGSACAARYEKISPQTLESFETTYTSEYGESTTYGEMSYVETPVSENIITNSKGIRILELRLASKVLDSKGNDITAKVCETCGGTSLHYIAFKGTGEYIDLWSIADETGLTKKIIDTLTL
jgi:hypothetical protein